MQKFIKKGDEKGFTLVELLVVIAIVAILAVVVIVAINPVDIIKKSRNTRRLSDLDGVKKAIDLSLAEATTSGSTTPFTAGATGNSCTGSQDAGGGGWVPYTNTVMNLKKYIPALPKDPQNTGTQCYTFVAGSDGLSYEIRVPLETAGDAVAVMTNDGGSSTTVYEVGTDLSL